MTIVSKKVSSKTGVILNEVKPDHPLKKDEVLNSIHDKYYAKKSKAQVTEEKVKEKVAVIVKENEAKRKKTVDDLWFEVLSRAVGKRLTDKAIAVQMSEEATKLTGKPKTYNEESVVGHRSGFNNGRLPCQKGIKPIARLEKFTLVSSSIPSDSSEKSSD